MSLATFAAGCFWHVEETFRTVPGVSVTQVGFMGGKTENPTYKEVCTDATWHAEVVHLEFDPVKVRYEDLLEIFWKAHDPTTVNRQGPDVGTQYRSAIFFHDSEQKAAAEGSLKEAQGRFKKKIATQIVPASAFYRAEEYHQQYLAKKGLVHCPT